jgi:hypothetical protein
MKTLTMELVWKLRQRGVSLAVALAFGALAGPPTALGGDSGAQGKSSEAESLLNLLEQKGLITAQEASKVRAEWAQRGAAAAPKESPMPKVNMARWIEAIDLYGDARLRFEHRSGENGALAGDDRLERNRWRYRLRVGTRLELTEQVRAGLRLESGPGGRSGNVTFGEDSGPWGKDSDRIFLGQLYVNWTPAESLSLTAGRQENPFQVTSLVWDPDLNPEGLSESFKFTTGRVEWFATFGQFLYDDANPDNPFGAGGFSDVYLFMNQVGARYHIRKDISVQVAPVLSVYSGQGDDFRGPFIGTTPRNSLGLNDLLVLEIPAEVRFRIGHVPARVFGDFAVNLQGADRARAAGTPQWEDEVHAWLAGAEVGSARRKGGWSLRAFYQASELYALDPNLVDSDLFDSRLNLRGFAVQGVYALTDFCNLTLTYAQADRDNDRLPTGAVGDLGGTAGTAALDAYRLFQLDLNLRF